MPDPSKTSKKKARRVLFPNLPKGRLTDSPSITPEQSRTSRDRSSNRRNSTPTNAYYDRPDGPKLMPQISLEDIRAQGQPQRIVSSATFRENGDIDGLLFKMGNPVNETTTFPVPSPNGGRGHVCFAVDDRTATSLPEHSPFTWYGSSYEDDKPSPSPAPRLHAPEFDFLKDKLPKIGCVGNQTHDQKVMQRIEDDRVASTNQRNVSASSTSGNMIRYTFSATQQSQASYPTVVNPNDLILKPGTVCEPQPRVLASDFTAVSRESAGSKTQAQVTGKLRRSERARKRTLDDMRNTNTMAKKDVEREREIREGWMVRVFVL